MTNGSVNQRQRVLGVLERIRPEELPTLSGDDLLAWGNSLADNDLLRYRGFGRKSLDWLRAYGPEARTGLDSIDYFDLARQSEAKARRDLSQGDPDATAYGWLDLARLQLTIALHRGQLS